MTDYKELAEDLREQGEDMRDRRQIEAADAIEDLISALTASNEVIAKYREQIPKWIPVTERLPDTCDPVLVCLHCGLDNDEITVGEYWGNSKASPGWGTFDPYVTHWMPLPPPPPKGEK